MNSTTAFIKAPSDWGMVTKAAMALTWNEASDVRCVGSRDELSDDGKIVDIVVMQLHGACDYAIEFHWKGICDLGPDAVGMYLALALKNEVIVHGDGHEWLLLKPNGIIENIQLDLDELERHSTVTYNAA